MGGEVLFIGLNMEGMKVCVGYYISEAGVEPIV